MGLYLRPTTLDDALGALARRDMTVLAGGTDHYPARVSFAPDEDVLDITALPGLRAIEQRAGHWWIPCLATWTDVITAGLPHCFNGLVEAARQVGGMQVQNVATLVGNICNASPAADGVPCLLALDAEVELASASGTRRLSLSEFVLGPRMTARRPDELVTGLRVPDASGERARFLKLGGRRYLVISIAMVAATAELRQDGRIGRARIAVGACSARAVRLPELEADLVGRYPDPALVRPHHLAALAPIDDIRASADYRRHAALELTRRIIGQMAMPSEQAA